MLPLFKTIGAIALIAIGSLLVYALFAGFDETLATAIATLLGVVGIGGAVTVAVFAMRGPPSDYEPPVD